MKNRYRIDGELIHWTSFHIQGFRPNISPQKLHVRFQNGSGQIKEKVLYGADAFALRLWLGKHSKPLNSWFSEIEASGRQDRQLSVFETNSGIAL